jgi:uncharacterized protein (UPF0335 family)
MDMTNNRLKTIVERLERMEEEKQAIVDDIKEIMKEAKGEGFEPKILKKVLALRKMGDDERERLDLLVATYMAAL